jgi:molybdate transport system substrate-binding protein
MSGGAPKEAFAALAPQFEKASGDQVTFTYAVTKVIDEKLAAGEKPDILVLPVPLLDGLQKAGKIRADRRGTLGIVSLSVVVGAGVAKPDISTPETFRNALLAARSVVHSTPGVTPSGTHLGMLMEKLGIGADMAKKTTHKPALDGGVQLVGRGEAELGIYPTSEIVNIGGLVVVGPVPESLTLKIVYGAGVTTTATAPDAAAAFIAFLTDGANRAQWSHAGFDPPPG